MDLTLSNYPEAIRCQCELTQCVLESGGLQALVDIVARYSHAVVVQDPKGMILAKAGDADSSDSLTLTTAPIIYNNEVKANVHLISGKKQQLHIDQVMQEFIVSLLSLELYKQQQLSDANTRKRIDFIYDLLTGEGNADEKLVASSLDVDFNQTMGLIVIDIDNFVNLALEKDERYIAEIREQMYLVTTLAVDLKFILIPRSDKLIVLVPLPDKSGADYEKTLRLVAKKIQDSLSEKIAGVTTTIGLGRICKNLPELRLSYQEAVDAVTIGRVAFGKDRVIDYKDLGIFLLLPSLRDNPNIGMLFSSWIGKIIDYDRTKGTDLLKTLEAYLDTNGDVNETTAKLFIHRNTLRYRLDKLNELTEGKFTIPTNKLQYLLLIKIWRLSK
ncbi:MAG: helix-turn-helix domain-containing protein [Negativicutes bacterium]|nr:helix-turn-helix domain-containing protein [Negativicutes bacterium]